MSMMGMNMQSEQSWSREGGRMMKMNMMGNEMLQGSDGATAWTKSPVGYALATDEQKEQLESQSGMFMFMIDFKKFAKDDMQSLEVVGEEEFDGRKCYKLHFTARDEKEGHVFFDIESGLPAGFTQIEEGEDGEPGDKATMLLKEWKEIEGVKFFHLVTMEVEPGPNSPAGGMVDPDGKMRAELRVDEMQINTLKDDHFALPDEVKKLVASAKDAENAPEIKLEDLTPEQQEEATKMIDGVKQSGMVKQVLPQLEASIPQMAEERKAMMQYIVQELRKELKAKG
jgi:hypothetical protein